MDQMSDIHKKNTQKVGFLGQGRATHWHIFENSPGLIIVKKGRHVGNWGNNYLSPLLYSILIYARLIGKFA